MRPVFGSRTEMRDGVPVRVPVVMNEMRAVFVGPETCLHRDPDHSGACVFCGMALGPDEMPVGYFEANQSQ